MSERLERLARAWYLGKYPGMGLEYRKVGDEWEVTIVMGGRTQTVTVDTIINDDIDDAVMDLVGV